MADRFGADSAAAGPARGKRGTRLSAASNLGFIHKFEAATEAGAPTLLLLHGTGGDENSLLALGRAIGQGSALLSPRGKVLEHGAPRFFERLAKGVFNQADLSRRTAELTAFLTAASKTYEFDAARVVAVGFSNGANIAASVMLRCPDVLAGAILIRAMVPFIPDAVDLKRKPVLLLSGIHDPIVQTDQTEELANIFRDSGAEVTLHWEEAGHNLCQGDVLMAFDWIRRLHAGGE